MENPFPVARHLHSKAALFFRRFTAACLLVGASVLSAAHAGDLSKADIERRFEPPLHVQDKLTQIPAWPLTSELEPEGGPVGYVLNPSTWHPCPALKAHR